MNEYFSQVKDNILNISTIKKAKSFAKLDNSDIGAQKHKGAQSARNLPYVNNHKN